MKKTPEMQSFVDDISTKLFGRNATTHPMSCTTCGSFKILPADFTDDISRKEFEISHLCQKCQDEVFNA